MRVGTAAGAALSDKMEEETTLFVGNITSVIKVTDKDVLEAVDRELWGLFEKFARFQSTFRWVKPPSGGLRQPFCFVECSSEAMAKVGDI